jgi:hypothetical protein
MATQAPVVERILGAVKRTHGCDLDTLAESVPELTWNQVFLEIDRLSREGQILVTCQTRGHYLIQLPEHQKGPKSHLAGPS